MGYRAINCDGLFRVLRESDNKVLPGDWDTHHEAQAACQRHEADERHDRNELAMEAGMMGGVEAYNDIMGFGSYTPDPCGHHCYPYGCPRCGGA